MAHHVLHFFSLIACILLVTVPALAQSGLSIVGVSSDSIATIDLVSGNAVNTHPITVPGKTVVQTYGVARDPQTGTVYAVVGYVELVGRSLITVDPATGAGTHIGQTPVVSDIAIGTDGTLYGIGGNFGSGGLLYSLNKATGAGTSMAQLSSGSGHVIAFNADDGRIYHGFVNCSDSCYFYLESVDPQAPTPPNPADAIKFLPNGFAESGSLVHVSGPNFLMGSFFLLNTVTGRASALHADTFWSGLTAIPTGGSCPPAASLYATGPFEGPGLLYSVNPATGATAFVGPVGYNDVTGIDFASDGVLYALGKRPDDSGVQVLLTIDPCTGEGTEVGPTGTTLREMVAAPGGGLYAYSGQNFSTIDRVTGAATTIGNSGITADDFGIEYSPTDDKIYFATIFNAIGTLYSIDPATGASAIVSPLNLPVNITALRAMDFNPGNNTMYGLIADSAFPGTTLLATVDTAGHVVSSVATTSRFNTLAFKNGTPNVNYQLTVIKEGSGIGTVTSSPSGIDCGATCEFAFDTGTSVTLTAMPDGGTRFDGWSGACTGTGSTCVTTMNAMRTVRARFTRVHHMVLGYGGANHGHAAHVTIYDAGSTESCSLDEGCDILVGQGEILLHAEPGPGGTFTQWEGSCSNGDPSSVDCQLNVNSDTSINADFFGPHRLTVAVSTNDPGAFVYDGKSHFCAGSGTCFLDYAPGASVALFAARGNYSVFKQFSNDCSGATCNLSMDNDHVVAATFADGFFIRLSNLGTGNGTVDPYVYCDLDNCNATFEVGTTVPLTAIPSPGSQFTGWGGACSGTGTCQATANSMVDVNITATFDLLPPQTLTVTKAGNGSGTVSSNPAGIACGVTCSGPFAAASTVMLTATPAAGSAFAGWGGDCSGSGACQVTMSAARNVTASFALQSFQLSVAVAGAGTGSVTATGINCPSTCSVSNLYGTTLTLTATADVESSFAGWSGACSGTGTCNVNFDAAKSVTANFTFIGPFHFGTTPAPVTVPAGQPAQFNLSVQQHTSSSGTMAFSCAAGLPSGASCSFNPNNIPFTPGTNATVNTQLTITTTPRTIAALDPPREVSPIWAVSLFAVIFAVPRRRRTCALFAVSVALLVFLPACGGGGGSSTTTTKTQSGTPAGSYTVTINGAAGTVTKTTTVILVVQ